VEILGQVASLLERRYHDPSFGGVGLAERLARARSEMQSASSEAATYGVVARLLSGLGDSHTFFVPPGRAAAVDLGWTPRMVGERCLVVEVRPGSEAARHGLRPGDEILAVEGVHPERANLWTTLLLARLVRSRAGVGLTVRVASGEVRDLEVAPGELGARRAASVREFLGSLRQRTRPRPSSRLASAGDVLVWRLSSFDKHGRAVAGGMAAARRHRALVLDLRGNPGGDEGALRRLAGGLLREESPATIGRLRARGRSRPIVTRRWPSSRRFPGPLVVVVDAESASASEVLARTVQLRRRGRVVGDRTAGAVGLSRVHVLVASRGDSFVPYGVSITEASVEMPDGATLETSGVVPDEVALPTPGDLRAGRDPVLARAVALAGGSLDPEAAGRLFPDPPPAR
jgi:carboxyl-terminal processing protease